MISSGKVLDGEREWIALRPADGDSPRKITKIIGLNGGGFWVITPYHQSRSGFLFKMRVRRKRQRLSNGPIGSDPAPTLASLPRVSRAGLLPIESYRYHELKAPTHRTVRLPVSAYLSCGQTYGPAVSVIFPELDGMVIVRRRVESRRTFPAW
jgi:hypothetical protein